MADYLAGFYPDFVEQEEPREIILQLGKIMNVGFEKVYLLQNPLNLGASEVISPYLYKKGIINANYSYSTAIGLFNSVINFGMVLLSNTISRKAGEISMW